MLNSDIAAFREDLLARDKASIIEIAVENYSIRSAEPASGRCANHASTGNVRLDQREDSQYNKRKIT